MKILITGANSYIGMSFETHMRNNDMCEITTVDMKGEEWKKMDFSIFDSIFHVAGIAHSDNGAISEEKKKLYYAINTDLAVEVAKKAYEEGVPQFIYMSSMIVYGESSKMGKTRIIDSKTPTSPANAYGDSKLQAEQKLLELVSDRFKIVILRPPMVYGKGSKGNYPTLSKFAKMLPIFPNVVNNRSMIYIENLCEFIRLMIVNKENGIYMPQNKEYVSTTQMVKNIAQISNHNLVLVRLLNPFLIILSPMIGIINKVFGSFAYDLELSEYIENYRICDFEESIRRTEQS